MHLLSRRCEHTLVDGCFFVFSSHMLYTDPNRPSGSQSETPVIRKAPDGSWTVTGYQHFILSADVHVLQVLHKPAKFGQLRQLWQRLCKEEQCRTLLDVGCSAGLAGFLALDAGIEQVRCIDHDSEYVAAVRQLAGDRSVSYTHLTLPTKA